MIDEKSLKLEARLGAIEYMIGKLFKMTYGFMIATGAPPKMIVEGHKISERRCETKPSSALIPLLPICSLPKWRRRLIAS